MVMRKRGPLSICYAVPGHYLLPESGPTRNVLSVAEALSDWIDVTVAFRKIITPVEDSPFKLVELDPFSPVPDNPVDDGAVRGTSLLNFINYLGQLRQFVRSTSSQFDVVLEKSWILSGYLVSEYQKQGVPGVLVENIVRMCNGPIYNMSNLMKYFRYKYAQIMIGRYMKKIHAIIAETDSLKKAIIDRWKVPADKISVVDLGVDRQLFHPMAQNRARQELGIDTKATVMLYIGVLDDSHDVAPIIEAMNRKHIPFLEFHLVGNGSRLEACRAIASKSGVRVHFHGQVAHKMVPLYIAASDIGLAPYNLRSFPNNEVTYSILKVHEYLSCGRPVISVPSKRLIELIKPCDTGFLISNTVDAWEEFITSFPSREKLRIMAQNVLSQYTHHGWGKTAEEYLRICLGQVGPISNRSLID